MIQVTLKNASHDYRDLMTIANEEGSQTQSYSMIRFEFENEWEKIDEIFFSWKSTQNRMDLMELRTKKYRETLHRML